MDNNEIKKSLAIGLVKNDKEFSGMTFNKFGAGVIIATMTAGVAAISYGITNVAMKIYDKHQEKRVNKAKAEAFDMMVVELEKTKKEFEEKHPELKEESK